jgi:hypothetical protein
MLFFKKRNETERYFFWNRNRKPKRNKYFSETKRNETKKKITVFNPCFNRCGGLIPEHPCRQSFGTFEEVAGRTTP